jgi:hypothetical protein
LALNLGGKDHFVPVVFEPFSDNSFTFPLVVDSGNEPVNESVINRIPPAFIGFLQGNPILNVDVNFKSRESRGSAY